MPKSTAIDKRTRLRIAAHLRKAMHDRELSAADVSRTTGLSEGTISRLLGGDARVGLDVVLALHRKLTIDANQLLDHDPPARFFRVGEVPNGHNPGPGARKLAPVERLE